jgi:hypothetical protein
MPATLETPAEPSRRRFPWPWLLLAVIVVPAVWHVVDFEDDVDPEFPGVARPTFSRLPPAAYRLAEPGDTIDRIAIYVSSLAVVLSLAGLLRARGGRRPWVAALAGSLGAFWYAANPGPTFDGWHGLGWLAALDPSAPLGLRLGLAAAALGLVGVAAWGLGLGTGALREQWRQARARGAAGLFVAAAVLTIVRQVEIPGVEPAGYWPRWAFVGALVAYASALVRVMPPRTDRARKLCALAGYSLAGVGVWYALVAGGIGLTWYHRPIDRLRAVVPGKIYISAMPTARGLEVANGRHHFKTIINLFPEDTPLRSPRLPQELRFARRNGIHYVGSPSDVALSNAFLDETLRLAQAPDAWPILVHCHGCMDRTPAWTGIYQFVVEGRPLEEVLRFIEGHRGYRPKASVTLLYNRVLPRLAPERYRDDPTAALLRRCARGTVDPYYEELRAEQASANRGGGKGVGGDADAASAATRPSLTPRR